MVLSPNNPIVVFSDKEIKLKTSFWGIAGLLAISGMLIGPGTLRSETSVSLQPVAEKLVRPASPNLYHDPRLDLALKTHYFSILAGSALARNSDTRSYQMKPLDVPDQMGLVNIPIYDLSLDFRLSRRNHLTLGYWWGQQEGEGTFQEPTGFNDNYYHEVGPSDGGVILDSLQLGWYYRALDRGFYPRRLTLDLGAGLRQLRSTIAFSDEDQEAVMGTEVIYAPLVPYLSAHSDWRFNRKFSLGLDLKTSLFNIPLDPGASVEIPLFTDMPADARFNQVALFTEYSLTRTFSVQGGFEYWDLDLHFTGLEDDGNWADNQFAVEMLGGYLGVNAHDPQRAAARALRNLLKR